MTIRVASPNDAEAIAAIYAPIVRDTTISFETEPPSPAEVRIRMLAVLESLPWLVSEDSTGRLDGYAHARKHRDAGAYQWSVDTSIYVRDDRRGTGVGKRLYAALFASLAELGYYRVFAGTALPNPASVALHRAVGFEPVGVYRQVGFKHGAWHDVAWWQRSLREPGVPVSPSRFTGA